MTWQFERVAGPHEGPLGGIVTTQLLYRVLFV